MKKICGIVVGEAHSEQDAMKHAQNMKNCPNLIALGTSSNMIYYVFMVPEDKEWWLKYPEKSPKSMGLEKAWVHIARNLTYPEKANPRIIVKKTRTAPCGAECQTCPLRDEYSCAGCPATVH